MAKEMIHEHHEHHHEDRGDGAGLMLGIVMLVVLVALFLVYGLPYVRNSLRGDGSQINVPDRVRVDVNRGHSE
ncbi:MAG: hypothetical protein HY471_02680 [Candidatus Sungbacteria bacterium]|nr:hypothetical protein [Candidatus Sungbacteria bacterium]